MGLGLLLSRALPNPDIDSNELVSSGMGCRRALGASAAEEAWCSPGSPSASISPA